MRLKVVLNRHFWAVAVLFAIGIILHYPQQILDIDSPSVFWFMGLTRHAVERILLLLPVGYASFVFGKKAGFIGLAIASAIMLPRVFLISEYFPDAALETIGVVFIGSMMNLWFDSYKKEKDRRQLMISNLEAARQQLQHHTKAIEESEKRLATINQISSTASQSLELSRVLSSTLVNIMGAVQADAAWTFLIDDKTNELVMAAHEGVPEQFAQEAKRIRVGEGVSGRVAESGQSLVVEDVFQDTRLAGVAPGAKGATIAVPLRSKGKVNGVFCVHAINRRSFQKEEIELLTAVGNQVGVAVENASLYQQQQEVAEELRISEQRYRELFESAHDAIWEHDLDGNITVANRASEALGGYNRKELIGMNVRSFMTEDSLNLAGRIRSKLFLGEPAEQPYEQRLIRRDGTVAILRLTTSLIRENGKPTGFLHIARDVTKEKEMQDKLAVAYGELSESHRQLIESQDRLIQAEKLTSLGQLAASVAHEINNPLSGVLTYSQLLIKKIESDRFSKDETLRYLNKMGSAVTHSSNLVRSLLDFARQSPPMFTKVDINEVIGRSLDLAAHSAELQHVDIAKHLGPSLPSIEADFSQLQQVCTNLVMNAIEAMPKGGSLVISTTIDGGQVKIEVQDNGVGISQDNLQKLFTPFFTTKREVKGVGLGLAVSYGIVQRHNGKIEVRTKEGEGTTFTVHLPIAHEERDQRV